MKYSLSGILDGNSPSKRFDPKPVERREFKPNLGAGVTDPASKKKRGTRGEDSSDEEGLPLLVENNLEAQKRAAL